MIHIIMVLSAIILPPYVTMDSSYLNSLESHQATTPSTILHLTDDTVGTVPTEVREDIHGLYPLLGTQLDPDSLISVSEFSPPTLKKSNFNQISTKRSSRQSVNSLLSSKRLRRRRLHHQGRGAMDYKDITRIEKSLQEPGKSSSVQRPFQLARETAMLQKKRIAFRNSKSGHETLERKSLLRTVRIKRANVRSITSDKFYRYEGSNNIDRRDESTRIYQNPVKAVHNLSDSNQTNDVLESPSYNMKTNISCDKVKRSIDAQPSIEEIKNRNAMENTSLQENGSNPHLSIRHSIPNRENSNPAVGSPHVGDGPSSSSDGTTNTTRRGTRRRRGRRRHRQSKNLSLWIDERQVKLFSGYMMEIYVIHDGRVLPYILDPNFEKHLPVIPFEVQRVNFTWQAGRKRYYYTFDQLYSHDPNILEAPLVSLPPKGRIPRKPKVFTVNISCSGNASGIASFDIGLLIQTRRGKPMAGTPLRLKLRKDCTQPSADPECDEKCENGGVCDAGRKCQCPEGYMGSYCNMALCYPQCMNGGTCTTPGRCTCPPGYQGRHCEGGICHDKCENGGKCIQKDTCACPRGYYGNRCEFSKCVIPCINGGRCRNVNKCRCPNGFAGDHCEVVTGHSVAATAIARCSRKCRHGSCMGTSCTCEEGFSGRWCRRRGTPKKRVWM